MKRVDADCIEFVVVSFLEAAINNHVLTSVLLFIYNYTSFLIHCVIFNNYYTLFHLICISYTEAGNE